MDLNHHSMTARLVSAFINACLFLSIIAFMMGTMPEFKYVSVTPPFSLTATHSIDYVAYRLTHTYHAHTSTGTRHTSATRTWWWATRAGMGMGTRPR